MKWGDSPRRCGNLLLNYVDYGSVLLAQRNWPVKQEKKKTQTETQALGNLITDRGSISGHQQEEEPVSKMWGDWYP